MLQTLDATVVRDWCATGLERLRRHQREINDLNVFPVPDGDTGTNLVLTVTAAHEALTAEPDGGAGPATALGRALHSLARGALLGARGNSGVILSQMLTGLAEVFADSPVADGRALAAALDRAAVTARAAVADPVEGTILTVARAAADAGLAAADRGLAVTDGGVTTAGGGETTAAGGLATVARAAAEAARVALARTPEQLPALARAGVVDAGGRGLVVLLDALVEVVTGTAPGPGEPAAPGPGEPAAPPRRPPAATALRETGSDEYDFEVQYLLDASDEAVDRLREVLRGLGDSLVVVGGEGTWNVHVHVNDVGAAMEAGVEAGRPYRISVTRFADQPGPAPEVAPVSPAVEAAREPVPPGPGVAPESARVERSGRAVVVICDGDGTADLLAAEGAAVVRPHPDGAAPSTGEILDAIRATGAVDVVVMPNDPDVLAAATAAADEARAERIHVGVVPTRSAVQALAALAVRDSARRFEDDVIAMAEAAGACRYAEVTTASRDAVTVAGLCQRGDVLALVGGEVTLIGRDFDDVCRRLLDRLLAAGGEMVTLLTGDGVPTGLVDSLTGHVGRRWPFVEVHCYEGGQPHYPLLVGVE
ncbi:DAK2 domain-containing protein [Planosporangium mesophilum]|uniref:DAK2 domain-containing protein n=1 Tax=Planosporangium mesophilum TaxID=689768 RepID=UPI00143C7E69|nr:DAK2 domain-containing protein [Planosporangium mesophilum]NJC81645.1 DAK2 domain-containing protein [Planosporangium mesophilum]